MKADCVAWRAGVARPRAKGTGVSGCNVVISLARWRGGEFRFGMTRLVRREPALSTQGRHRRTEAS